MTNNARRLRDLMDQPGVIVAPGAYDAMSAKLIQRAGFPVVYVGSLSVSGAVVGLPDTGLVSPQELIEHMARIADTVDIPVVADLDDGGGNRLRIRRNIRLAENAGFAAIHIEDTDLGAGKHLPGAKEKVISKDRMVDNIRAAVDARRGDMMIIGRTDAYECESLQQVVDRAGAYAEAGADLLFLAYVPISQLRAVLQQIPLPLFGTMRSRPPSDPSQTIQPPPTEYKLLTYPSGPLFAAMRGAVQFLSELKSTGRNIVVEDGPDMYEVLDDALCTKEWLTFLNG